MYQEGTLLVHPTYGVCKIVQIGKVNINHVKSDCMYYTLEPVYDSKSKLYIPTDSDLSGLRPVLTKECAQVLINRLPIIEPIAIQNEKEREKEFKELIKTGDCDNISRVIKTLYLRKMERTQSGKKAISLDEKYFYIAREHLHGELAIALGIEKDEVETHITNAIEKV